MRKKFKIMLEDGTPYRPPKDKFVVMNPQGVFFLVDKSDYYTYINKLSLIIGKYDVVWRE